MDLVASASRPLKVKEIPYTFRNRLSGESKLDSRVAQEFIILFLEKLFGGFVPIRFLLFAFVGALGLIVHLAVLGIMVDVLDQGFREGQTMAVLTAMTRSEEHTSELQSLMRSSYAVFCLKTKK